MGQYSQSQSSERADRIWMVVASATETFTQKNNNIYQTHNIYLPYPPKKILQRGYLLSCHIRLIF